MQGRRPPGDRTGDVFWRGFFTVTQHHKQLAAAVVSMTGMVMLIAGVFASLVDVETFRPFGASLIGALLVFTGLVMNELSSRRIRGAGHR